MCVTNTGEKGKIFWSDFYSDLADKISIVELLPLASSFFANLYIYITPRNW